MSECFRTEYDSNGRLLWSCRSNGWLRGVPKNNDPHYHANLHICSAYQHKSLKEIVHLMKENVLAFQDILDFHGHVCREEHFDQRGHEADLERLETKWNKHNQAEECDTLCQLPSYIMKDTSRTLWDKEPISQTAAQEDGDTFKQHYHADAQVLVLNYTQTLYSTSILDRLRSNLDRLR